MGRAGAVRTVKILPSAILFVPKSEVSDYKTRGHREVIGVPASVRGITATRNWILNFAQDARVVFVDDDVKSAGWLEVMETQMKRRTLTEAQWLAEFSRLFDVTEQFGFRLWGLANISAPRAWYPWKPFIFYTYVTGSCMGIVNKGLRFDEAFKVKEDYELCLRCIKEDGGVLGCRYLYWENEHWTTEAGCRNIPAWFTAWSAADRNFQSHWSFNRTPLVIPSGRFHLNCSI